MKYTIEELNNLELESGDIGATKGNFPIGTIARCLFTPDTDRYHFFLVQKSYESNYLCDFLHLPRIKGNYAVVESIGKGITISELTNYKNTDVEFYRVNCPEEIRKVAPVELAGYSRSGYDYQLFIKLLFRIIKLELQSLFKSGKFRKLKAEEMPCDEDSQFICTEGVDEGYDDGGYHLIPTSTLGIPSAFKEAELLGRMNKL